MAPGWTRREYRPDGPLYARRRLVFSGVPVERDALIPAGLIRSKVKHQRLWQTNQAGHEPRNTYERKPYGKPSPAPTAPPAAPVQPAHSLYDATCSADAPSETVTLPGVASAGLAEQIASREIAARSQPVKPKKK